MPHKGFRQTAKHRARIRHSNLARAARIREALAAFKPSPTKKKWKEGPTPIFTAIPPSASAITSPGMQRWALYSHHAEGKYYYKREHADTLDQLQILVRKLDLELPLWTYCKSGHVETDLVMPIRIPELHVRTYGLRWQPFTFRKKKHA